MPYGFNDNTYTTLRSLLYRDVFRRCTVHVPPGTDLGSALTNAIIVDEADRPEVQGLEGDPYIDKMIELKYVELKT